MLPSTLYTFLLASALTVSAVPLKAVDDIAGNSVTVGNVLSDNEAENLAAVNTGNVIPPKLEGVTTTDPVNVVTEVTEAAPVVDNAIPEVDGSTPKNIQIIKRPTTDGKVTTFKQVDGKSFFFDFLGGFCCANGAAILESGDIEKCEISEACLLEITAFENEEETATAILQADKSGVMQVKEVKDLKAPATPQVDDAAVNDIFKGANFDKVNVVAKDLGKKEKRDDSFDVVVTIVETAFGINPSTDN